MNHLFDKQSIIAEPGFNRWRVPFASVAIHLCIGSVYAWSIFNPPLTRVLGVVSSAAGDWSLSQVVRIFTVAIVCLGLSAAIGGKWLERVGPRLVGTVAAACWGGGFLLGSLGIWLHQLWLLYFGYGVVGGIGLGLGYVSPVSTLLKWFPDRRGMAAGMAIMGFGGGAIIGAPLKEWLLKVYFQAPMVLGVVGDVALETHNGQQYAKIGGQLRAVVLGTIPGADKADLQSVFLVGTGSTGVAETFATLGIAYFFVMLTAAFAYRIPAPGWRPAGWEPTVNPATARRMISAREVDADRALRCPQFYLLWVVLCFNVTAGIGVLGVARTMMTDIFRPSLPHIVDEKFAATFVLMIGVFNMLGRFFWASVSDYMGRKPTYTLFFVLGIALYLAIPWTAAQVARSPAVFWLVLFYGISMLIFTMYGGGFSTVPAYLSDLFGARHVGAIHGRLLTAWSTAGVLGPELITAFREQSRRAAIRSLTEHIPLSAFERAFGAGKEQVDSLVAQNTVTIDRLMKLAPAGTPNPSSSLYNSTMYWMAGLLALALVANLLVFPVHERHHAKQ